MAYTNESVTKARVSKSTAHRPSTKPSSRYRHMGDKVGPTHRKQRTDSIQPECTLHVSQLPSGSTEQQDVSEHEDTCRQAPITRLRNSGVRKTRMTHIPGSAKGKAAQKAVPERRADAKYARLNAKDKSAPDSIELSSRRRNLNSDNSKDVPILDRSASLSSKSSTVNPKIFLQRSRTTGHGFVTATGNGPSTGNVEKPPPASKAGRKPGSLFSSFFTTPPASIPGKKVTCLTCLSDDIPISKSAKLACSHRMCHACLKRIFTMSLTDPQHMPPRCCTSDHIPLKYVDKLFDTKFKMKWNKKYQEYTTKNRIYCPAKGCGEWIKPSHIYLDTSGGATGGRKFGKCSRCKTRVCCTCNGKWHSGKDCPKDEDTKRFVETAKEKGWQRCYSCSAMVELKEGCNHMTCRCTAEFCMICGSKWKTCDCPWFNYDAGDGDRLNFINVPRGGMAVADGHAANRNAIRYQEELDRRREQERRDEALARRLQLLGVDDDGIMGESGDGIFEIGNARGHFMNEHFVGRPTDYVTGNERLTEQAILAAAPRITARRAHTPPPPADRSMARRERNRNREQTAPPNPPPMRESAVMMQGLNPLSTSPSGWLASRRDVVSHYNEATDHRLFGGPAASGFSMAGRRFNRSATSPSEHSNRLSQHRKQVSVLSSDSNTPTRTAHVHQWRERTGLDDRS